jgi:hypothetical protein
MILQKFVDINITPRNITYYKEKGYDVNSNNIQVKIDDLPRYSRIIVEIECDNCHKISKISYSKYMDNFDRYHFYTCKQCSFIKKRITYSKNLGVDNPMKLDEFKEKGKKTKQEKYNDSNYNNMEKYKKTCMEHFGFEYALQFSDVREKIKETCKEKYGVESIGSSQIIQDRIKDTKLKRYGDEYYHNISKMIETKYNKHDIKINKIEDGIIYATCDNNHNFSMIYNTFYYREKLNITICPICNPIQVNISDIENNMIDFIKYNYDGEIILNDRKILDGKELDIYLPDLKIAFEFNGIYWHNELKVSKNYHKDKTNFCLEKEIQLVHVWEDDWINKQDIVKSMILNKLKKTPNKIFARKCKVLEINDNKLIKNFLNKNHLQGFIGSKIKIGLFYNDELIGLMSFGGLRKAMNSISSNKNEYEMLRYCNRINTNIIGGASKLFKYFIDKYNPISVISYADRGFSNGKIYELLGFTFSHITEPNYYYVINGIRKHRFDFRKDVLIKQGYDSTKSEHEIMLERKIYRVYNSGNYKFIYHKQN